MTNAMTKVINQARMQPLEFADTLLQWFDDYGRHDLPWQHEKSPYRVWVSEIMLQQTQVKTVIPYYQRFMERFPQIEDLAIANQDEVLTYWAGLGYYARGRNLHKAAQIIVEQHSGSFPESFEAVLALPGIGRSTAGAILSIAVGQRYPILDGNVKRVLARFDGVRSWPGERKTESQLWQRADALTPEHRFGDYTQAIMDLGATVCTRSKPQCQTCPLQRDCVAFQTESVGQLPVKKPKKEKPTRQAYLLILRNSQGQVWLEKRPPNGIWGGLWSFPQLQTWQECLTKVESHFSNPPSLLKWEEFRHTFSHYHLLITPVFAQSEETENHRQSVFTGVQQTQGEYPFNEGDAVQAAAHGQWMCQELLHNKKWGVPAPVQKLVLRLQEY